MELKDIRANIDAIDDELVRLFVRRMDCSAQVARAKQTTGKPIRDPAREREILNRLTAAAGETCAPYVDALYSHIFDLSRSYQASLGEYRSPLEAQIAEALKNTEGSRLPERALVACQGAEGAYAQQACARLFRYPDILYFNSFEGVFNAVEKGMCRYGILPVENSTAGSVTQVYDLMEKHRFHIVGAKKLRIDHRLMRKNGSSGAPITEVVSHEQALRQCSRFFAAHPEIKATVMENTAVAARFVTDSDRDDLAVIASRACADLYGLDIVEDDISDSPANFTRFICICRKLELYPGARKVSLMLNLAHEPGALSAIVSRLALAGVNLLKLESRPLPGREFEFRFFFDMTASVSDPAVVRLLCELEAHCDRFTFLGCYDEE
ncbi:MAG: chorismate mutase [Clostridia bacterium]|nr:chorismate mutase [Clostridia bacterium]